MGGDQQLLMQAGVVWAVTHFWYYLYGHNVTIITDHAVVKTILGAPKGHAKWWSKLYALKHQFVATTSFVLGFWFKKWPASHPPWYSCIILWHICCGIATLEISVCLGLVDLISLTMACRTDSVTTFLQLTWCLVTRHQWYLMLHRKSVLSELLTLDSSSAGI